MPACVRIAPSSLERSSAGFLESCFVTGAEQRLERCRMASWNAWRRWKWQGESTGQASASKAPRGKRISLGKLARAFTVKPQGRAVQEHGATWQQRARRQEDFVGEARQSFHDETAGPVDGQAWCQGWTAKGPLGQGWLHEAQPKAVTRSAKGQRQEAQRCNAKTLTRREDFAGEARQSFHGETAGPRPKLQAGAKGLGRAPAQQVKQSEA